MGTTAIIAALDEEIVRLQQVKKLLDGSLAGNGLLKARGAHAIRNGSVAPKRVMSAEARERIAAAQRKRWAKQKKAAK
jgi:hypothetical protein